MMYHRRHAVWTAVVLILSSLITLTHLEPAAAQRFGQWGGSGRGGGFGGRGGMLGTLRRDSVRTELALTDAQKQSIDELQQNARSNRGDFRSVFERMRSAATEEERQAVRDEMRQRFEQRARESEAALEKILTSEQLSRLRQLTRQAAGTRALAEEKNARELGFTSEQKEAIEKLREEYSDVARELGFRAPREEREKLRAEWDEKILAALSAEQRETWQTMLGEPLAENPEERRERGDDRRGRRSGDRSRRGQRGESSAPETAESSNSRQVDIPDGPDGSPGDAVASFATGGEPPAASDGSTPFEKVAKTLTFNFRYAPWPNVLKLFADATGLTLDLNDVPPGTFNYYDTNLYTPTEALDVLNGYLLPKGFLLVRRDRFLVSIKIENGIPPNLVPSVGIDELPHRGRNELLSIVLPLDGLDAEQLVKEIEPLMGPQGTAAALTASNSLVLTDIGRNLMRINRLLDAVVAPMGPRAQTFRAYPLKHISATEAEQTIRKLFGLSQAVPNVSAGTSSRRGDFFRSMFRRSRGDSNGEDRRSRSSSTSSSSATVDMQVATDLRTNSLLVTAPAGKLRIVDEVIRSVDVPQDGSDGNLAVRNLEPHLKVYELKSADPREVSKTLNALMPGVVVNEDDRSRRIHVFASPAVHQEVEQLIRQLDGSAGGQSVAVIPLHRLDVYATTTTLRSLFSGDGDRAPTIEPDASGRRLIVRGPADQVLQVRSLLQELGEGGSMNVAAGSGQRGPIRSIPLGGRDPEEFVRLLQQVWSASGRAPLRIIEPPDPNRPLQRRQPLGERDDSGTPPRDATAPQRDRSLRLNQTRPADVPVVTASRTTVMTGQRPLPASEPDQHLIPQQVDEVDVTGIQELEAVSKTIWGGRGWTEGKPRIRVHRGFAWLQPRPPKLATVLKLLQDIHPDDLYALQYVAQSDDADVEPRDSLQDSLRDRREAAPGSQSPAQNGPQQNGPQQNDPPQNDPQQNDPQQDSDDADASRTETKTPVAVSISGGSLVLSSRDMNALDRLEQLIESLTGAFPAKTQWTVFYLRAADASETAVMLSQLFPSASVTTSNGATSSVSTILGSGLSSRQTPVRLRIIPDVRSNALYVTGPAEQIRDVEDVLKILDASELPESLRDRVPRFIPVEYADVNQVAQIVRDVYKDYMGGDQNGDSQRRRSSNGSRSSSFSGRSERGRSRGSSRPPEIRLTLGVDTRTSHLIVSANDAVFREIDSLVESLDQAAFEARRTVRVVNIGVSNAAAIQQTLGSLLPQVKVSTTGSSSPPATPSGAASSPSTSASSQGQSDDNGSGDDVRRYFEERFRERMRERFRDSGRSGDSTGRGNGSSDGGRRSTRRRGRS